MAYMCVEILKQFLAVSPKLARLLPGADLAENLTVACLRVFTN